MNGKLNLRIEAGAQKIIFNGTRSDFDEKMKFFEENHFVERLWKKDASLWKKDPAHEKIIQNSLGWLSVVEKMRSKIPELLGFSKEIKESGFENVVLLGMGGSSLAPELFRLSLPTKKGYPKLFVLDSTDPGWVSAIEHSINIKKTLFIFASKSGTTIEPYSFFQYFYHKANKQGNQFVAVTDPGTFLEKLAADLNFRKVFLNPSDIGGRFSALSYFGLVPAALAGMDITALLDCARAMVESCGVDKPLNQNPAVQLGILLGESAQKGKDKVTLVLPKKLAALGLWVEQLVAESSGKEGKGIVPIAGEALSIPNNYSADRLFIFVSLKSAPPSIQRRMKTFSKTFPVVHIQLNKPEDIGGELIRWEIATAAACSLLNINAFDQPDVQSAKDVAKSLLKALEERGSLPSLPIHLQTKFMAVTFSQEALKALNLNNANAGELLAQFLRQTAPRDYFGILAYFPFNLKIDCMLSRMRILLRDQTRSATLFGYGPRYLHSTGQLHKGGPNTGLFFVFTADCKKDLEVPESKYRFGQLEMAQATGDFKALDAKGRRAVRVHFKQPLLKSLNEFVKLIKRP